MKMGSMFRIVNTIAVKYTKPARNPVQQTILPAPYLIQTASIPVTAKRGAVKMNVW